MKDSGIAWVGEIPDNWEIRPLYYCFSEHKNKNYLGKEQNLLSLSYGKIIKKDINTKEGLLPDNFNSYNIVESGDIIIRPTDLQNDQHSLRTGLVIEKGIITSAYIALRAKIDLNSKFYNYLLHSYDIQKVFYNMGNGVRQGLNYDEFSKLKLVFLPIEEQKQIADYLDGKCGKIDTLKEDIKKQIETLEQYKRSVITEAVTKGLNKSAPLKDSGIPWVGEIPDNWEIRPLYYCFSEHKNKNYLGKEQNLLSLSYGKIIKKDINTKEGLLPDNFNSYNIVESGDIIIRPTDLQNDQHSLRTGLVIEKGIITSAYIALRAKIDLNSKFYNYLLHSYDIQKVFYNMGNGVRQGLNYDEFSKLKLVFLPIEEQKQIADYLDKKCAEIDKIISDKQSQIVTLEEYKKSLIFEYVTGKKQVG